MYFVFLAIICRFLITKSYEFANKLKSVQWHGRGKNIMDTSWFQIDEAFIRFFLIAARDTKYQEMFQCKFCQMKENGGTYKNYKVFRKIDIVLAGLMYWCKQKCYLSCP